MLTNLNTNDSNSTNNASDMETDTDNASEEDVCNQRFNIRTRSSLKWVRVQYMHLSFGLVLAVEQLEFSSNDTGENVHEASMDYIRNLAKNIRTDHSELKCAITDLKSRMENIPPLLGNILARNTTNEIETESSYFGVESNADFSYLETLDACFSMLIAEYLREHCSDDSPELIHWIALKYYYFMRPKGLGCICTLPSAQQYNSVVNEDEALINLISYLCSRTVI